MHIKKEKKIALFLIYRKGKSAKETPAQTKAIDNTIKRINDWIKDKNSGVDMVIDPEKLPEGSFADRVHFNNNGAKTVLANLQTELIKSKETTGSLTNYKGKTPIKTPAGYKRVANAPREIQEQAVVLLKAILKDPNNENQIGKTQKNCKR